MSTVTDRIAAIIAEHREQGWNVTLSSPMCSCGDASAHSAHLAETVAEALPDVLKPIIASAIRGYSSCESQALSYHGDESGAETLRKLDREADGIAAYAFTSAVWRAKPHVHAGPVSFGDDGFTVTA